MPATIKHFGNAGHFVMADRCLWHLHTHVGNRYCISSVGELYPDLCRGERGEMAFMSPAFRANYESYVFRLRKDGQLGITLQTELYHSREEAEMNHAALVKKYSKLRRDAVIRKA